MRSGEGGPGPRWGVGTGRTGRRDPEVGVSRTGVRPPVYQDSSPSHLESGVDDTVSEDSGILRRYFNGARRSPLVIPPRRTYWWLGWRVTERRGC